MRERERMRKRERESQSKQKQNTIPAFIGPVQQSHEELEHALLS